MLLLLLLVGSLARASAEPDHSTTPLPVRFWWGAYYQDSPLLVDALPPHSQRIHNATSTCVLFAFKTVAVNGTALGPPSGNATGSCDEMVVHFSNASSLSIAFDNSKPGFSVSQWALRVGALTLTFLPPPVVTAGRHMSYACQQTISLTNGSTTLDLSDIQLEAHLAHKAATSGLFSDIDESTICQPKSHLDASIIVGSAILGLVVSGFVVFVVHICVRRKALRSKQSYERI